MIMAGAGRIDRLSMCGITLSRAPLREQAQISAALGCSGMGIFHPVVPEKVHVDTVRRILDEYALRTTICVPKPFTLLQTTRFSAITGQADLRGDGLPASLEAMIASLEWLAPLKPDCVLVIPGAQGMLSRAQAWDSVCTALSRLCAVADRLDMKLCIEPVHPRFAADTSIVSSIDQTLQMIVDVGAPNLGVLIEIFHIWDVHDRFEQIARATGKITAVQLSDSAPYPRSLVDRLPPGDGVADIAGIVRAIETTGYRGWYDIEVVSDDGGLGIANYPDSPRHLPPRQLAERCVRGSLAALQSAQYSGEDGGI